MTHRIGYWLTGITACGLVQSSACNQLGGLDDLRFVASTGGAAGAGAESSSSIGGGGAGQGGTGGSGGGTTAKDWSASFTAIYRFDTADLTLDSGPNLLHLTATGPSQRNTMDFIQGSGALDIDGATAALTSSAPDFYSLPGTSLTFGGWFRLASDVNADVFGKGQSVGYALIRNNGAAGCVINDSVFSSAGSDANTWPANEWRHVACTFDNTGDLITAYLNGQQAGTQTKTDIENDVADFTVPYQTNPPFAGLIDELFFARVALDAASIMRVFACGIDGARCTCDASDPKGYIDCGSMHPLCSTLVPCDSDAP